MCFVNETATTEIYTYLPTLSLHDALPISLSLPGSRLHGFHQGRVATPPENTRKLSGIQGVNPRLTDDFIREEAVDERGCIRQGLGGGSASDASDTADDPKPLSRYHDNDDYPPLRTRNSRAGNDGRRDPPVTAGVG